MRHIPERRPLLQQGGVNYLLRDEFDLPRAAGSVNGTAAEPGPGTRNATSSNVVLSDGNVEVTGVSAWESAYISNNEPIARVAGRVFKSTIMWNSGNGSVIAGLASANSHTSSAFSSNYLSIIRYDTKMQAKYTSLSTSPSIFETNDSVKYAYVFTLRANGKHIFIDDASVWKLCWVDAWVTTTPVYPIVGAGNTNVVTSDYCRIPDNLFLPTPIASDGFSSWGTTDGSGHAETAGIGSGGNGRSWTDNIGTWTASAGAANASALSGGIAAATVATGTTHLFITVACTRSAGDMGITARYTDSSNYLRAYHNGTNAILEQVVSGTPTTKITAAATYSAGAQLRLIVDGVNGRLYYNDALVGTTTSINAGLTATNAGLYTTDTGNTFDNFTVYARGTGGEYAILNSF